MDIAEPGRRARKIPIAIVAGCLFRYDAISAAVVDMYDALAGEPRYAVSILTSHNELAGRDVTIVRDVADLILNAKFLEAELIIYHFGIFNPLHDAILIGNGRAPQVVSFHNITPPEFLPASAAETIEKSFRQLNNLRYADRLWPVSQTNAETLAEHDFPADRIDVVPLPVSTPDIRALSTKRRDRIELLFLGRVVQSKGVLDLVSALAAMPRDGLKRFRLRIAGNLAHSDPGYVEAVKAHVAESGIAPSVEFLGTIEDSERDRLLVESHVLTIPSYHEGFCKPVIEAMRAGCVPVGYAAYNLRYIANDLCRMGPSGNVEALSAALSRLIGELSGALADPSRQLTLDRGAFTLRELDEALLLHVAQFEPGRIAGQTRRLVRTLLRSPRSRVEPFPWLRTA